MAILLRAMLILIPIFGLFLWIRWRMKRDLDEETREVEFRRLQIGMTVLVLATLATGLGLRFFDDDVGEIDSIYVPDRIENGKVIPGYYIPKDSADEKDGKKPKSDESGGGPGGAPD